MFYAQFLNHKQNRIGGRDMDVLPRVGEVVILDKSMDEYVVKKIIYDLNKNEENKGIFVEVVVYHENVLQCAHCGELYVLGELTMPSDPSEPVGCPAPTDFEMPCRGSLRDPYGEKFYSAKYYKNRKGL